MDQTLKNLIAAVLDGDLAAHDALKDYMAENYPGMHAAILTAFFASPIHYKPLLPYTVLPFEPVEPLATWRWTPATPTMTSSLHHY